MSSPVERLEAWCDEWETKRIKRTSPILRGQIDAAVTAYRTIIAEYRQAEAYYHAHGEGDDFGFEPVYDTWYTAVKILADAHNPEGPK